MRLSSEHHHYLLCDKCGPGWFDARGNKVHVLYDVYDLMAHLNVNSFPELIEWAGVDIEIWRDVLIVNKNQMMFPFTLEELEEVLDDVE